VQGLEVVELGNGELIVNVTEHTEMSRVTDWLSRTWTWDSLQIQTEWDDETEGATEWLVLMNCKPKAEQAAA
jgi:hypothetical protein